MGKLAQVKSEAMNCKGSAHMPETTIWNLLPLQAAVWITFFCMPSSFDWLNTLACQMGWRILEIQVDGVRLEQATQQLKALFQDKTIDGFKEEIEELKKKLRDEFENDTRVADVNRLLEETV